MQINNTFQHLRNLLDNRAEATVRRQDAELLTRLDAALRQMYPGAPHDVRFFQTTETQILCTTQSSAWAAKLSANSHKLLSALAPGAHQHLVLRIKVVPEPKLNRYPEPQDARVSSNAVACVTDLASELDDSDLKLTLQKLSTTLSRKKQN